MTTIRLEATRRDLRPNVADTMRVSDKALVSTSGVNGATTRAFASELREVRTDR